ncbi:MAG: AmpE protein [Pseudomonadota bacterium]|nr:AmpE protein [Pseudomonadota bacterium]
MALICIILALLIDRSQTSVDHLREFHWFDTYSQSMMRRLPGIDKQGAAAIIILLLPILVTVILLQYALADQFYDLFSFGFALAALIYSLDGRLDREIKQYLHARETGLDILAQQYASTLIGKPAAETPPQQTTEVMHGLLQQSNRRLFAVLFWFTLLGPAGALLYRLTCHTLQNSPSQTLSLAAHRFEAILSWAPVILMAGSFALAGDYESVTRAWRDKPRQNDLASCNYHTLIETGLGGIRDCPPGNETACIRSLRALILRSLIIWLALIAILTLIGWMA